MEKLGLKTRKPKAEPESDWFFKHTTGPDGDGKYTVPNGKWNADGTPEDYKEVDAQEFNKMVFRINISILEKKIGVYAAFIAQYENEIARLEKVLRQGVTKTSDDMNRREQHLTRIKWMWQYYGLRFRNKENTTTAKAYKAKILEMERKVPAKTSLAEHHHIKDRVIDYDLKAIEVVAVKKARGQKITPVKPTYESWEGDAEDLIGIYNRKIDQIEDKYLDDAKDRLEANEEWLNKSEEKEEEDED